MDEKDRVIQQLMREMAKWKNRALEVCEIACFNCEEYASKECAECRIPKIREDATEGKT